MAYNPLMSFDPVLPWENNSEETNRFLKLILSAVIISILISSVVPFLTVAELDRAKTTTIPPRLVKMILEQKKVVEPPPPPAEAKEEKKEEEKPEEKKEEVKPIEIKTAKEVAKKHIAVFDALADLRDLANVDDLKVNQSLSNDTGQAAKVTRSLITKKATQGSGGIIVATASRSSGIGALKGQNVTKVTSNIGDAVANTKRKTKSGNQKRSDENIQLAFDKNKSAIFALYHRSLRKDPSLQGRVVFRLTISASGKVTACSVDTSEIVDPKLLKRLVSRIKRINFGAQSVVTWNDTYQINFLPS
ncbi:MAG: protein TonB [Polaribacter sp.]|jgi:protein TonB